jgi:hypothetical protein
VPGAISLLSLNHCILRLSSRSLCSPLLSLRKERIGTEINLPRILLSNTEISRGICRRSFIVATSRVNFQRVLPHSHNKKNTRSSTAIIKQPRPWVSSPSRGMTTREAWPSGSRNTSSSSSYAPPPKQPPYDRPFMFNYPEFASPLDNLFSS